MFWKHCQPVMKAGASGFCLSGAVWLFLSGLNSVNAADRLYTTDRGPYPGTRANAIYADKRTQKQTRTPDDKEVIKKSGWIIEPEITLRETLTDNLRLTENGEDSDFITTVTPGISIRRLSRRLFFELDFNYENLFYRNNSNLNDGFHLLRIDGTGELIEDHFFLDLSVKNSQQNVSRTGRNIALDNISQSADRTNVLSYNVSPYWRQRVGNFMDLEARYRFDEVSSDQTFNSDSENITLIATSGSDFSRLLWELRYDDETIDNQTGTSTEFRTVVADLEYLLTRKLAAKGTVGYDDNEFTSSDTDITGPRWSIGGVWRPSTRTSLEATIGRRFFGTDIFVDASHRSRRTQWQFSFTQKPSTTRATLLEQQVFTDTDIFGQPIDPVTGEQVLLDVTVPEQTTEVLIRKRFRGSVNYTLRKNIFNLTMFHETREFQIRETDDTTIGADISWRWLIGPRTSSNLTLRWNDSDFGDGDSQEFYITEYQLTRSLGKTLEANIGFRRVDRLSNNPQGEYTEHRIFAGIYKVF